MDDSVARLIELTSYDMTDAKNLGFEKLRLGVLSTAEIQDVVWNWFGDHGCFIGNLGAPDYCADRLTDPLTTPFERLLYVYRGTHMPPIVAVHLLPPSPGKKIPLGRRRKHDPMEILPWDYTAGELTVYELYSARDIPAPLVDTPDAVFLQAFPTASVWVGPLA